MKKVKLVSISFPGRDLSLAPVSLKEYALKHEKVAQEYSIDLSQFEINTSLDEICEELETADIYGFSTYVWNINQILDVTRRLKETNPKIKIILGGPEVSDTAEKLLLKNKFIDYIIVGEGEIAFKEFLTSQNLEEVPNLVYRKNGSIVSNPETPLKSLDDLMLPYENKDYRNYLDNSSGLVRAAIETSRGCPLTCGYCSWGRKQMRYLSLKKLKPAFKFLFRHPNVAAIYITDSNPFLKKERARELLSFLIKNNVEKKPITFELNPEHITDDRLLDLITQLNSEEFAFGVQSTSPKVLQKVGRKFDAERYRRNICFLKERNPNIKMWFSLILGLPEDNYEQFSESLDFVLNLKPEGIYIHELLCLPGSPFYKNPEKYGIEFMEEAPHKILKNKTFPQEEYDHAKNLSYHISLIHRMGFLRDDIFDLSKKKRDYLRLIDIYEVFIDFIDGKIDTLSGRRIQDVSSWFFEQHANDFIKDTQNVEKLQSLYDSFKGSLENGGKL